MGGEELVRGQPCHLYRAFEAVENMALPGDSDFESLVVVISADLPRCRQPAAEGRRSDDDCHP